MPDRLSREFHPLLFCGPSVPAAGAGVPRRFGRLSTALSCQQWL